MLRTIMLAATLLAAAPAVAQDDLLSASWDDIVAQAKDEGELTWYVWYFQPEFREQVRAFEEEYGITVKIPDVASGDDAKNKMLAEAGRESGDIDVISLGGDATNTVDVSSIFFGPILPVLPEAEALTDQINGGDGQGYAVAYWGNQTGMAYDSNRVDLATLPNTVEELAAWMDANPGQLGFNYENGGSGPSFIHNIARNILGISPDSEVTELPNLSPVFDWFNAREDKFVITASNADSLIRLNSGEFLLVPAWEDHLFSLIEKNEVGDHIHLYVPDWGMNGGGNIVAIPANAPHKAAALLFVSWLTSAETQTTFNQRFGTAPTNTGADDSQALISSEERNNTRLWTTPIDSKQIVLPFVENVVQD